MTERIVSGYRRLFEIRLLHHYWLDEGSTAFDFITPSKRKDERLLTYDIHSFLKIAPAISTEKNLRGHNCIYKDTALGCIVAAPDNAEFRENLTFDFAVTIQQAAFHNYTALTLQPQNIYELYYEIEDKIRRFKDNVPVLSNLTGAARIFESDKVLFLSREFPGLAADDHIESLVLSGSALLQLTGDQPGADAQMLTDAASDWPVFIHQGDVPDIIAPAGLAGVPERGIELTDDIPTDTFALIRLYTTRSDDDDFSLIGSDGHAKTSNNPVFQIRFKNRSTFWEYKNTGVVEPAPLPLTCYGNAGTKQKPSQSLVKAVKSGDKITRIVSEIYV
ncbi:MAG: hypothetical protein ABFD50_13140 [Smithella sp.]